MLAILILVTSNSALLVLAGDTNNERDGSFELIFYDDDGSAVQPRINADGTFTYSFTSRLHSSIFTATSDKISLSFITSTNTKAYYYIALYDVTESTTNPTFKSMTQSKDNNTADSKTFNVTKGRRYQLTFSKLNPKNYDLVSGRGTIYGIKA